MNKCPATYDVCECNHESMSHAKLIGKCFTTIPLGKTGYRGWVSPDIESETCKCKRFKFSAKNTANPKSSEDIES